MLGWQNYAFILKKQGIFFRSDEEFLCNFAALNILLAHDFKKSDQVFNCIETEKIQR